MSVSNSESSDINNTLSASDSESESIDVLSRSLRLTKGKLEKKIKSNQLMIIVLVRSFGPFLILMQLRKF